MFDDLLKSIQHEAICMVRPDGLPRECKHFEPSGDTNWCDFYNSKTLQGGNGEISITIWCSCPIKPED